MGLLYMNNYRNNAFRVLGLLPSVSMEDIISRVSEIKVKKFTDAIIVYEYDFPWMGPLDRSDENVINALQRLENPVMRLKEEIFWFWIESDDDKQALEYLKQNKRQAALEIWRRITRNINLEYLKANSSSDELPREVIRASLNAAVLVHSTVLAKESTIEYQHTELRKQLLIAQKESHVLYCPKCQKKFDKPPTKYLKDRAWCSSCGVVLITQRDERIEKIINSIDSHIEGNDSHWNNWCFVLDSFVFLNLSNSFWLEVNKIINTINDPRLPLSGIKSIQNNFLLEVTNPNLESISNALSSKDYDRVTWHSNLLSTISLPSSILRNGFNKTLGHHIDLIYRYCDDANAERSKSKDNTETKFLYGVYSRFTDQVKSIISEGNLVDINCISNFALARDKLASVLREISVEVHNRCSDLKMANEIILEAAECAASPHVKEGLEKDVEELRNRLINLIAVEKLERQVANRKNWSNIIWAVIIIGGIVSGLLSSSNNATNSHSTYTSSSSYQSSPSAPLYTPSSSNQSIQSAALSALEARITALKASIEIKETLMNELATQKKSKESELASLKSSIEKIESQYKNSTYGFPANVNIDYNNKISEFNNVLLPSYNNLLSKARELYSEYEQELKTCNKLVDDYNRQK